MAEQRKRILILGGGFGGVATAQELQKRLPRNSFEIHLVSQENFSLFTPMLPEVAGGGIETRHILNPLRQACPNAIVTIGLVVDIDLQRRSVTVVRGWHQDRDELAYDYLVIALGAVTNFSEVNGMAQHAFSLRTLGDALYIRNHVIAMLEEADSEDDPARRREQLTFVVAGGGFSGVETMAELRDLIRGAARHYRRINPREIRLVLLHMMDRLLPELSEDLGAFALRSLERSGVEVRLRTLLAGATESEALIKDADDIPTRTLICTVGTAANPALASLACKKDERGRIVVTPSLEVEGWPGVWALGDCAAVPLAGSDRPAPPTAQFALREGTLVARNVAAAIRGGERSSFTYKGLGQFVSLGHRNAVVEAPGGIKLSGFLAWWMWRTYYLGRLPGLSRKMRVAFDWSLDLVFGRDITQLPLSRGQRIGRFHYEAGDIIVRQGDPADLFYVIAEGEVEIVRAGPGEGDTVIAKLGTGEYFGEMALLGGSGKRSATVRALTAVNLVTLGRDDFTLLARSWSSLHAQLQEGMRGKSS